MEMSISNSSQKSARSYLAKNGADKQMASGSNKTLLAVLLSTIPLRSKIRRQATAGFLIQIIYERVFLMYNRLDMKKKQEQPDKIDSKTQELESGWQRCQADFDNYRKRTEAQRAETIDFIKADFLAKITPVLDNFRRAFEHAPDDEFAKGIKQIEKQLEDILNQEGLTKISCEGEFNPNLHEAISYEQNPDIAADHIIAECESGWQFNGKVIKPAKVRVSKGK
jgi:molecular chaperone GrpE